jgi:Family of unknown function (DUF6502)
MSSILCENIPRRVTLLFMDKNIPVSAIPETSSSALVSAIRHLLRPLVRVMLTRSLTYPFMANLLKSIYVEVAAEEFRLQGKPQTDSRISLLSGVHRKDVKRLRPEAASEQTIPPAVSLSARLVKLWTTDPRRLDETGRHRPLPRLISEGGAESFEALVNSVSKDIRSRVILDEWLRTGVASIDDEGRVCLNTDAFFRKGGFDEKAYYFGQNVHDHMGAAAHNLLGATPPFTERAVQAGKLTPESVAELSALSRKQGLQVLNLVGKRAEELEERDRNNPDARLRMSFGIYNFSAENKEQDQ